MTTPDPKQPFTLETYEKMQAEMHVVVDRLAAQMPGKAGARMKDVLSFRKSITSESDRGAVLMSAAYLDDQLKELLAKRLVQDKKISRRAFDFNGPLGTFSSRIDFAYLLGILPKNARLDLHIIRAIRNQFAHYAAPLSYEDEKVKPLCNRLVFHGSKIEVSGGAKFRRSVMGLLSHINLAFEKTSHIEVAAEFEIPDRIEDYETASKIFTKMPGAENPLKHEYE